MVLFNLMLIHIRMYRENLAINKTFHESLVKLLGKCHIQHFHYLLHACDEPYILGTESCLKATFYNVVVEHKSCHGFFKTTMLSKSSLMAVKKGTAK